MRRERKDKERNEKEVGTGKIPSGAYVKAHSQNEANDSETNTMALTIALTIARKTKENFKLRCHIKLFYRSVDWTKCGKHREFSYGGLLKGSSSEP